MDLPKKISELVPFSSTSVKGVFVCSISPIKMSRTDSKLKYIEGQLNDGSTTVRLSQNLGVKLNRLGKICVEYP